MHLLCPQSYYPTYFTEVLDKGEYIFATAIYFSTDGKEEESPKITVGKELVNLEYDGKNIEIHI